MPSTLLFWLALAGAMTFALLTRDDARVKTTLLGATTMVLGVLTIVVGEIPS